MINQKTIVEKILLHLNGKITELELVHWAEDALLEFTEQDEQVMNEQVIMDTLMYIGAGDSSGFPLTWEVLSGYLEQFGTKVRVLAESA